MTRTRALAVLVPLVAMAVFVVSMQAAATTATWKYPLNIRVMQSWGSRIDNVIADFNFDPAKLFVSYGDYYAGEAENVKIFYVEHSVCWMGRYLGWADTYKYVHYLAPPVPCTQFAQVVRTDPFGGTACGPGDVEFAYVVLNSCAPTFDSLLTDLDKQQSLITHETNHAYGPGHVWCGGPRSVMKRWTFCSEPNDSQDIFMLTSHDKSVLGLLYP